MVAYRRTPTIIHFFRSTCMASKLGLEMDRQRYEWGAMGRTLTARIILRSPFWVAAASRSRVPSRPFGRPVASMVETRDSLEKVWYKGYEEVSES